MKLLLDAVLVIVLAAGLVLALGLLLGAYQ